MEKKSTQAKAIRKIVDLKQIHFQVEGTVRFRTLALASDGTAYELVSNGDARAWLELPDIYKDVISFESQKAKVAQAQKDKLN